MYLALAVRFPILGAQTLFRTNDCTRKLKSIFKKKSEKKTVAAAENAVYDRASYDFDPVMEARDIDEANANERRANERRPKDDLRDEVIGIVEDATEEEVEHLSVVAEVPTKEEEEETSEYDPDDKDIVIRPLPDEVKDEPRQYIPTPPKIKPLFLCGIKDCLGRD